MRIQVVFNNTPILVPCGDGKLTVGELIQKAIVRFKKLGNKHHEATIEVRSLRLADTGSFVDEDDEVADVLEDKETVLLDYEYIPHYTHDSISEESGITATSTTFSPSAMGENHTPYSTSSLTDSMAPVSSEGYATAESNANDTHTASQEQDELSHLENGEELRLSHLEASQDTELVAGEVWHSPSSEERSPHLGRKSHRWNSSAGRDILLGPSQDSGYDPNRSQDSYNPKSQEGFIPRPSDLIPGPSDLTPGPSDLTPAEGSTDYNLPGNRESLTFTSSSLTKRQGGRKDGDSHKSFPKEGRYGQRGRDTGHDGLPPTPTRPIGAPGSFQRPEYGYRNQRDSFPGYPGSYSETGFEDSYERRYPPSDWRRSYHGEYYHHEMSPYGRYDPYEPPHFRGRFDRPQESLRGRFPQTRRDRLMSEESSRMHRARSHERMDVHPPYMGPAGRSPWDEPRDGGGAMDYFEFLSQPNPSYFAYDRSGFNPGPAPAMMGYDSRQAMAGPSGYSLSQPGHMMSHGRVHGEFDRSRMPPWGGDRGGSLRGTRGVLKGDGYDIRGRTYSIDEELDELDELDEQRNVGGSRGDIARSNPFQRNFRKSMFRDGPAWSQWMERIHEYGIQDDEPGNEVPEFEGDTSQSQRTPSPAPSGQEADIQPKENGEEDSDEDEFGNIHIIELHKGEEPLGVHLMHYTSPEGSDLGVFIGAMDENGFAAKSNKLQVCDRILACNGVDFTKETNKSVEELFLKMAQDPLLRIAISRGLQLNLPQLVGEAEGAGQGEEPQQQQGASAAQSSPTPPPGKIVSSSTQLPSTSVTNTRQIGMKHSITLTKGPKGLGFGLTSRDVATDNSSQPIYIKSITTGGPAFVDGRLKIGDRLLEVNNVDVVGMDQPGVVSLLREAEGSVTVIISRQETVDTQDEEFPSSTAEASQPTTVGRTVMTFDIPLYNSGPAGLGVTVYGRTSLSAAKRSGDMGIYIKSIVPGGAAALDGWVCRNDQLLCINGQSLLGRSNHEALEVLRGALASASVKSSTIQLMVARRAGINRKAALSMGSFSSSMAALGEEPEEEERESDRGRKEDEKHEEVGIDVPAESRLSPQEDTRPQGNKPLPLDHEPSRGSLRHRSDSDRDPAHSSHTRDPAHASRTRDYVHPSHTREPAHASHSRDLAHASRTPPMPRPKQKANTLPSPHSQRRQQQGDNLSPNTKRRLSSGGYPSPGSQRLQAQTLSGYATSPGQLLSRLKAAEGAMGSGEFYDRLEPLDPRDRPERSPLSLSPSHSSAFPWRDVERGREYSSLDRKGTNRSTSQTSSITSSLPPMHARLHHPPSSREGSTVISPSEVEVAMTTAPYGSPHFRDGSLQRPREGSPLDSRYPPYSPYSSDSAASYPLPDSNPQVPTRGSGRRNRPERGSGRNQGGSSMSSPSSEPTSENCSTYPRSTSQSGTGVAARPTTPTNPETSSLCSLEHLRLSDSEQPVLRRDDVWRISITKKSKKNPKKDFANFGYANIEPLVEGEAPALVRTGSDPCLAQNLNSTAQADLLLGMELGPSLGLAKSSSLESLHNVMHLQIRRDSGSDLRNRETRNSFRRAVDHSYDENGRQQQQQRGVDVAFDVESLSRRATVPAVISFTKSPMGKKPRKKGFLKRVFKRKGTKKGESYSPNSSRKTRATSMDAVLDSCDELDEEMPTNGHYQLQTSSQRRYSVPTKTGEEDVPTHQDYMTQQGHIMPILSDDDSNDESLLATMARV